MDNSRKADGMEDVGEGQLVEHASHGYIKEGDKEKILVRLKRIEGQVRGVHRMVGLKRIEGQVRGVHRMVDEEKYCIDVLLTQIASAVSALEKVGLLLLNDHVEHCVRESMARGGGADEKVEELTSAVERFLRV